MTEKPANDAAPEKPTEIAPEKAAPQVPQAGQMERLFQLAMLGMIQRYILAGGGVATISLASIPEEIPLNMDIAGDIVTIRAGISTKRKGQALVTGTDANALMERLKNSTPFGRRN